ncbi:hypothetical protein KIN20_026974 [Parelaphostrongylus tenuis]|uniref:Serine aminopeptidase S33 domain-containing protein n=1 Tax=Parelaphostrongylus tenuis TaxID=148309 RepID=A0AAD5WDC4_PARTN|nr:hypothetical protein KIN20_026974 [Parelaphostrongylus tenuis]
MGWVMLGVDSMERSINHRIDALHIYEKALSIRCPTLVCHGDHDAIVDHHHGLAMKERIANCEMFLISASHQGIFCERKMWDDVSRFLHEKVDIMEAWVRAVQESSSDVSGVIYGYAKSKSSEKLNLKEAD